MAFNKRIMAKLEDACEGNEAMQDFMRELVVYEMDGAKQYVKEYERLLKLYAKQEKEE